MTLIELEWAVRVRMTYWAKIGALACVLAFVQVAPATADSEFIRSQLRGTIGPYPIGMQVIVREQRDLKGGHYFYNKHLVDIPLQGEIEGEKVTLRGADGGVFSLHFVGKPPKPGVPLTFDYSDGLVGVWTRGGVSLPVTLRGDWRQLGAGRLYQAVTDEPDAVFEAKVRKFLAAVQAGDRAKAAKLVSYPAWINEGDGARTQRTTVRNPAEFLSHWDRIFTPGYVAKLKKAVPHDMFVRGGDGMAMILNGEIWFDAEGVKAINAD
jgi:hypothetical protein